MLDQCYFLHFWIQIWVVFRSFGASPSQVNGRKSVMSQVTEVTQVEPNSSPSRQVKSSIWYKVQEGKFQVTGDKWRQVQVKPQVALEMTMSSLKPLETCEVKINFKKSQVSQDQSSHWRQVKSKFIRDKSKSSLKSLKSIQYFPCVFYIADTRSLQSTDLSVAMRGLPVTILLICIWGFNQFKTWDMKAKIFKSVQPVKSLRHMTYENIHFLVTVTMILCDRMKTSSASKQPLLYPSKMRAETCRRVLSCLKCDLLTQRRCDDGCLNRSTDLSPSVWQGPAYLWSQVSGLLRAGDTNRSCRPSTLSHCRLSKTWTSAIWPLTSGRPLSRLPEEPDGRTSTNQ